LERRQSGALLGHALGYLLGGAVLVVKGVELKVLQAAALKHLCTIHAAGMQKGDCCDTVAHLEKYDIEQNGRQPVGSNATGHYCT